MREGAIATMLPEGERVKLVSKEIVFLTSAKVQEVTKFNLIKGQSNRGMSKVLFAVA